MFVTSDDADDDYDDLNEDNNDIVKLIWVWKKTKQRK